MKDENDPELMIGDIYFDNLTRSCPLLTEIAKILVTGKRDREKYWKKGARV